MPITSSAKKALRVAHRKEVFNARRKGAKEDAVKTVKKFLKEGKVKEAEKALSIAYKAIDKAVKTKFLKKNTAARYKSRLTILVNKAKAKK
ncbi:MAG: 30S ribosomal protein S20 [Candidatus Paceibacterota bacterium]|jgi:small subunit ribosomal protein S20